MEMMKRLLLVARADGGMMPCCSPVVEARNRVSVQAGGSSIDGDDVAPLLVARADGGMMPCCSAVVEARNRVSVLAGGS